MSSFEDRVSGIVQSVLSDSTQLPAEFVSALPQIVAQNPVPKPLVSGARIAYGIKTANVTTTGTTFAAGTDILATALKFSASGSNTYILRVHAPGWSNSAAGNLNIIRMNLDGADNGVMAYGNAPAIDYNMDLSAAGAFTPSVGEHSVNARFTVGAGTGTIQGGSGGAGLSLAIIVTLEVV